MNCVCKDCIKNYGIINAAFPKFFNQDVQDQINEKVDDPCYNIVWRGVRNLIRDEFAELKLTLDFTAPL